MTDLLQGSLARIADFDEHPYEVAAVPKDDWRCGDYAVGTVTGTPTELYVVEDCKGDHVPVEPGDRVVGAFGHRAATLEGVGSFRDVDNGRMHALTGAALLGRFTSLSPLLPGPLELDYEGSVCRNGVTVNMRDFAIHAAECEFRVPTILLVGTSMSAGKTMTGALVCRILSKAGYRVVGSKLTGAGRYRDIRKFADAGANEIFDFVDAGLPSTVVPESDFREAIRPLLSHIQSLAPDFLVAEAGASPQEPYNGAAAIEELNDGVACTILCASDPYAVVGVQWAFGLTPDLVSGPATNTSAGIDLVRKLTGVRAINGLGEDALPNMRAFLTEKLGLDTPRGV